MSSTKHLRDYFYYKRISHNALAPGMVLRLCEKQDLRSVFKDYQDRIMGLEKKVMKTGDKKLEFVYATCFAKNSAIYINKIRHDLEDDSLSDDRKWLNVWSCLSVLESSVYALDKTLKKYFSERKEEKSSYSIS